jgi:hypothetical protein
LPSCRTCSALRSSRKQTSLFREGSLNTGYEAVLSRKTKGSDWVALLQEKCQEMEREAAIRPLRALVAVGLRQRESMANTAIWSVAVQAGLNESTPLGDTQANRAGSLRRGRRSRRCPAWVRSSSRHLPNNSTLAVLRSQRGTTVSIAHGTPDRAWLPLMGAGIRLPLKSNGNSA